MATQSVPELNRRLLEQRGAFVETAGELRDRLQGGVRRLEPRRIVKRHPEAALVIAAAAGLIAGSITGRIAAALLR